MERTAVVSYHHSYSSFSYEYFLTLMETLTSPITVWIVEDDEQYRQPLAFLLNHSADMRCAKTFVDCEAALKQAKNLKEQDVPDIILLDINLPGLSGIEGIGQLKALLPQVGIVMLTIIDDADTIFEALRAGASGYLLKNASVDQITTAIREARQGGTLMPAPVASKVFSFFTQPPPQTDYGLTSREKEVLQEMSQGYTKSEIAERLYVSRHTVNAHIRNIYEKLHVHSGIEAVAKAIRERLI